MRYFIIPKDRKPFFTDWYDDENYEKGMMVVHGGKYTVDGKNWEEVSIDHWPQAQLGGCQTREILCAFQPPQRRL